LAVYLYSLFGSASIGVYTLATEKMIIAPLFVSKNKVKKLEEWLKVPLLETTIGGSVLIGALSCANSNGIILPHIIREEELAAIKTLKDINITIMETKKTAYGNLILTNDRGAISDPRLKEKDIKEISDTLGVEVVQGEIAGLPYVGALAVATNKGVLAHPLIKKEEKKLIEDVLKVSVGVGTVNCGIPYVATGVISNSHAAVVGELSTGPEIFIIEEALDVME